MLLQICIHCIHSLLLTKSSKWWISDGILDIAADLLCTAYPVTQTINNNHAPTALSSLVKISELLQLCLPPKDVAVARWGLAQPQGPTHCLCGQPGAPSPAPQDLHPPPLPHSCWVAFFPPTPNCPMGQTLCAPSSHPRCQVLMRVAIPGALSIFDRHSLSQALLI